MEIAGRRLRGGAVVDYPTPPSTAFAHNDLGVSSTVQFDVRKSSFLIGPGDFVATRINRPTRFEVLGAEPAEYTVTVDGASR